MKNKKAFIKEIFVSSAAFVVLLIVLAPTIFKCIENNGINKSKKDLYTLSNILKAEIVSGENSEQWLTMIKEKRLQQVMNELKKEADGTRKIDISDYYLRTDNGDLMFLSIKHPNIDSIYVKLPKSVSLDMNTESSYIDRIQANGIRIYVQDEALNPDNPEQMIFSNEDDLKKIFANISVSTVSAGGERMTLSPDSYTLSTDGFDMSAPGTKKIRITASQNTVWNSNSYTEFTFEVLPKSKCGPLTVDFGANGTYELAAWDWSDYVAEASLTSDTVKTFGASIVHFNESYYYYPDGFLIDKKSLNSTPDTAARDIDYPEDAAYRIPFDTAAVIMDTQNADEMANVKNGSLMTQEGLVYIWQTDASKELDSGWIRVYCELTKK